MDTSHESDSGKLEVHVSSVQSYLVIFAALIGFTALTVAISYVHLGALNLAIAVVIATMKASLVVLYFMHLKWDQKFNALIFIGSLLFAGIFLAYTVNDTAHRGRLNKDQGLQYNEAIGEYARSWTTGTGDYKPVKASGKKSNH